MQKSIFTLFLFFFSANLLLAQDYPPDPKPGMCYIRCKKELVEKKVKHVVVPEYKEYKVVGAVYETVTEEVVITPASKRYEYVPAVYREVMDTVLVEDPIRKITIVPVKTITSPKILPVPNLGTRGFEEHTPFQTQTLKSGSPTSAPKNKYLFLTLAIPGKPQKTWGALANAISIPNRSSPWDF